MQFPGALIWGKWCAVGGRAAYQEGAKEPPWWSSSGVIRSKQSDLDTSIGWSNVLTFLISPPWSSLILSGQKTVVHGLATVSQASPLDLAGRGRDHGVTWIFLYWKLFTIFDFFQAFFQTWLSFLGNLKKLFQVFSTLLSGLRERDPVRVVERMIRHGEKLKRKRVISG